MSNDFADAGEGGYQIIRTALHFAQLEQEMMAAIAKNRMILVTRASASDGAKAGGLTIRGDMVIGVFRNDFAVRMLEANVDAGRAHWPCYRLRVGP
jgi:hypothetical protein